MNEDDILQDAINYLFQQIPCEEWRQGSQSTVREAIDLLQSKQNNIWGRV